ncbi:polysaccharide deacetylase family protein [Planococcus sp. A6]|uniref:polysaccharide deacetylase family protein n=1 Tax=Planococcus sp. A6 TaxID=2992760 RepID=UPI00237A3589|nr:polysaccharide deacetylase family protein [Planococcus sp. A6]MDE0582308.1 polysaccharide deacetylase family protein [Planococcus sp. A6]
MKKLLVASLLLVFMFIAGFSTHADAAEIEIPVVNYHVISYDPDPNNLYQYSAEEFEKQMAYLKENGYSSLTIDQYFEILDGTADMPAKPILITFDDSTNDFYPNAFPILEKYDLKATQFTIADWVNDSQSMTAEEITTVMEKGIDIQNHTSTHPSLDQLSYDEQYDEINDATATLKSITGETTEVFAYPYGAYNDDTLAVVENLGFKGAFTIEGGVSTDEDNRYELPRFMILNGDTLDDFIRKLSTGH